MSKARQEEAHHEAMAKNLSTMEADNERRLRQGMESEARAKDRVKDELSEHVWRALKDSGHYNRKHFF